MRSRLALMLALMVVVGTALSLTAASALASDQTVLAQAPDSPDEDEPLVGEDDAQQDDDEGEGESEPGAETGVEEGQTETAEEETGPVWTYQMSRISIVLFLLLALGIGGAYYNFVVKRQKEGV